MENFIEGGAFEVPDPENSFTAPFFLVEDEHGLKNYVDHPGDAPEENPNHRLDEIHFYLFFISLQFNLFEGEHISAVATDAAHPSMWTKTLHEPTILFIQG